MKSLKRLTTGVLLTVALLAIPAFSQLPPLTYPKIITTLKLPNQSNPIQLQTLFVPAIDGMFRITAYVATPSTRAEPVSMQIYWMDKYGSPQSANLGRIDGTIGSVGGVVVVETKQAVLYSTYFHLSYEITPLPLYDVTATVERLTQ